MNKKIKNIMLLQPNFSILKRRTWILPPYNLGILNSILKDKYNSWIYDPNLNNLSEEDIRNDLRRMQPDLIGITSFSTEYTEESWWYSKVIKEELPNVILVAGGILPTVALETIIEDKNIDFFVIAEGEYTFIDFIDTFNNNGDLSKVKGLAYRDGNRQIVNESREFIENLDVLPFPDYGNLDIIEYGNRVNKYCAQLLPRQYPCYFTISSRGCPFGCIFCAAHTVTGKKVRMRSAESVLKEIDYAYKQYGIKEFIYLDDHFLSNRKRAIDIMQGIIERDYGISWKCVNVAVFSLDEEIIDLMVRSGSYQITLSPESGSEEVLKNIIKKPVKLDKVVEMINIAKAKGLEVISNFVIGFPGETWEQIRQTIEYAEKIDVDMVNFHIATPLPKTELMDLCIRDGYVKPSDNLFGYTKGVISTSEFTNIELQILRAFEWDRINFKTDEKKKKFASMEAVSMEELNSWRLRTRRKLGMTENWAEEVKFENQFIISKEKN